MSAVPYDDNVVLRAPLAPRGSENPLRGKKAAVDYLTSLFPVLGEVRVIEYYTNEEMTAICTEAFVGVINPPATLRVADRFTVNTAGQIIEQENHYDPRPALPPGR